MSHKPNDPRSIDPALVNFMSESQVQKELDAAGGQFMRVTFMKKCGAIETRVGQRKQKPRVDHATASQESINRSIGAAQGLRKAGNVFLDYPRADQRKDGKRGFSFNTGRVIGIRKEGSHLPKNT